MEAWERQPDEPVMWFHRFDRHYRPVGPERTLRGAYSAWRSEHGRPLMPRACTGGSWRQNCQQWRWQERAEAWDAHQRRQRLAEEEKLQEQWRTKRRRLLDALYQKIEEAIDGLDPKDTTLPAAVGALEKLVTQLRKEYDDLPDQGKARTEAGGGTLPIRIIEVVKDYGDPEDGREG